jgi:hypothetical protein
MTALRSHLLFYVMLAVSALGLVAPGGALGQTGVPPGVLEGIVVARTPAGIVPVPEAEVRVFAGRSQEPVARGFTGRDGTFRFTDLRPGAYRVVAAKEEVGMGQAGARLTEKSGARVRVLLLPVRPRPPAPGVVEGRVVGMQGNPPAPGPVSEATVVLRNASGVVAETQTNERGLFRFENVAAGQYLLVAFKRGVGSAELRIEVPQTRGVRVEVRLNPEPPPPPGPPPGVLEGRVVVRDGGAMVPVPEAMVRVFRAPVSPGQRPVREGMTNREGHFRFTELEPGAYLVVAFRREVGEGRAEALLTREQGARVMVVLTR